MIVAQEVGEGAAEVDVEDVPVVGVAAEGVVSVADDDINAADAKPSIPSPTPPTQSPPPSQDIPFTSHIDLEHTNKVLSMQDEESKPAELQEVVEVVTTGKLVTKVVTAASATITAATTPILTAIITVVAPTLSTTPSVARRRKGVVIRDLKETTTTPSTIINTEPKSKDNGKGIMVHEPKPLKKKTRIEQNEAYARELETKEQMEEEDSKALKRISEIQEDKAAIRQKLDEEIKELRRHLQIVPNDEDNVYTKATPLALKVPVVDYEIYTENNKPYYKIKRADGSH
uniref:Uncharacterized protein n=1 Tax=Tanacetum cinerariifolium TaxID=118510 RepID=A0A6L2JWX9_TANCI|nr:hypothetical protein [Tanacetum cinerariifolium]